MKYDDGIREMRNFMEECLSLLEAKSKDYSGISDDMLYTIKEHARLKGHSPFESAQGNFLKQYIVLDLWIKGKVPTTEPIKERLKDMINYLLLIYVMTVEDNIDDS